ncbi:MAG: high frequency lysogenization protein HflD [Candidatus Pelagadaptatus aseana]|uniref:high frequency lysogenization protein HflD n=1 Tax=Candidatus Pelagadaptatus aseana TaxID=3120508 RepID=UPI0039B31CF2
MSKNWTDITLALAGVFQSATLVDQIAKTGYLPTEAQQTLIQSLFVTSPDDTIAVYGGSPANLEVGLKAIIDTLATQRHQSHGDILRYVLGLQHLQKKLQGRQDMLKVISNRIQQTSHQAEHFGPCHENVMASLADIYTETISTFKFRIQVMGDFSYLQQNRIANQVRALLFAGVRSATHWRQVGGTRFQMILQRKRIAQEAERLLHAIRAQA